VDGPWANRYVVGSTTGVLNAGSTVDGNTGGTGATGATGVISFASGSSGATETAGNIGTTDTALSITTRPGVYRVSYTVNVESTTGSGVFAIVKNGRRVPATAAPLSSSGGSTSISTTATVGLEVGDTIELKFEGAASSTLVTLPGAPTGNRVAALLAVDRIADYTALAHASTSPLSWTHVSSSPTTTPVASSTWRWFETGTGGRGTHRFVLRNATDSAAGTPPSGLTFDPTTGVISGTPTVTGTFDYWVRLIDEDGTVKVRALQIIIPS